MTISERKIRGLTAVCIMLAVVPFIVFFAQKYTEYKIPVLGNECADCLKIEIVDGGQSAGVYFVHAGTTANGLLKSAGFSELAGKDFPLTEGMKLVINASAGGKDIAASRMTAAQRLSLGLPIDINRATEEDLVLIKGIGPKTAEKILDLRKKINRFENIRQLMEVKGIKEKRLARLRQYLYVEKRHG